jgi:poly(A) RNA polymerase GLD2
MESDSLYYSHMLNQLYNSYKQPDITYLIKTELRKRIYNILVRSLTDSLDLFLIGSSQTGVGSHYSDCDLCLILYDSNGQIDRKYDNKLKAIGKLCEINMLLKNSELTENGEVIPAQVPILKFYDRQSSIEVNININRTVTIRNTHLLYIYAELDYRVKPLIVAVKLLARKNGINRAFNKSLTSYSINLMVIYFLQTVCEPPVLPCLQNEFPNIFTNNILQLRLEKNIISKIGFQSRNTEELGLLFLKFLEYYSYSDKIDKVISIRTASYRDKSEYVVVNGNQRQWNSILLIEEPFDLS